jgi:hypothetical protein
MPTGEDLIAIDIPDGGIIEDKDGGVWITAADVRLVESDEKRRRRSEHPHRKSP